MKKTLEKINNQWEEKFGIELFSLEEKWEYTNEDLYAQVKETIPFIEKILSGENKNITNLKGNTQYLRRVIKDLELLKKIYKAKQIKVSLYKCEKKLFRNTEEEFLVFRGYSTPFTREIDEVFNLCKESIKIRRRPQFCYTWSTEF